MTGSYPEWSRRLQASDTTACTEVFDNLHPPLLRYALRLTQDNDAAYDIVQDAFIKMWQIRATLDPHRSLKALLYKMVRNLALNHNRTKMREKAHLIAMPSPDSPDGNDPEESIDVEKLGSCMREWIAELPSRRREAFQLSRFAGLKHEEIAEVMNLRPRTVTNHIMLALQHLRDRFHAYQASGGG